jgi:hypothetical protein
VVEQVAGDRQCVASVVSATGQDAYAPGREVRKKVEHRSHRTPGGILHQNHSGNAKFFDSPAVQLPHDFSGRNLHFSSSM